MKLNVRKTGTGKPLIILHGLFGSADNWMSIAKELSESYTLYLVDQRNHGDSGHSSEWNYHVMAADIVELMDEERLDKAFLMGHSMGGKTAMRFAQMFESRVDKLVVADMGIKEYQPHHQLILQALNSFDPKNIESRADAEVHLRTYLEEEGTVQFLLKNLYWIEPGVKLGWRINLPVLNREIGCILQEIKFDKIGHIKFG
jgi:pimeloyl-ACP methyl ester carboxylesterase